VRVPWIVRWKGRLPEGKLDDRPVIQLDILPTALAAAGVEAKPEWKLDGVNLLPYLTGERSEPPHKALYWRFGKQIAIREGDWKLVKAPGGGVGPGELIGAATVDGAQLYNLATDIGEQTNLATKEPAKVQELAADWQSWNSELVAPKWIPSGRAAKVARNSAEPGNPASASNGPWKAGDALDRNASPRIAQRGFVVGAEVDAAGPEGVIVAQGGPVNGFALFVHEGRLAFAIRETRKLTTVTAAKPIEAGLHRVEAQLAADGKITLSVDGAPIGEGRAPGLLRSEPGEGLTVGDDGNAAVGEYTAPNKINGTVQNVTVHPFEK
jgi:hypothetical protein